MQNRKTLLNHNKREAFSFPFSHIAEDGVVEPQLRFLQTLSLAKLTNSANLPILVDKMDLKFLFEAIFMS